MRSACKAAGCVLPVWSLSSETAELRFCADCGRSFGESVSAMETSLKVRGCCSCSSAAAGVGVCDFLRGAIVLSRSSCKEALAGFCFGARLYTAEARAGTLFSADHQEPKLASSDITKTSFGHMCNVVIFDGAYHG